jgi:hypothetical protein
VAWLFSFLNAKKLLFFQRSVFAEKSVRRFSGKERRGFVFFFAKMVLATKSLRHKGFFFEKIGAEIDKFLK